MNVAWQFIARKVLGKGPPRRERYDRWLHQGSPLRVDVLSEPEKELYAGARVCDENPSHRTLRGGSSWGTLLAINCQPTFIWSLRDNMPIPPAPHAHSPNAEHQTPNAAHARPRFLNKAG